MKTKVAIVIERADIALGGAERSVFELAAALGDIGLEVDVLAAKGPSDAPSIRALCNHIPAKRTSFVTFARALKAFLAENRYDIVHSVLPFEFADIYQPRGGSYAESILRNADSYGNKLSTFWKKATAFTNYRRNALLRAERRLCRHADKPVVAALSKYVAEQFRTHYGCNEGRVVVIPNGVNVDKQADAAAAARLRSQIITGIEVEDEQEPVFFLFVANNFRLKGLTCLVEAMALAAKRRPERPPFVIVAGAGSSRKYRHLAKNLNVARRIVFLGPVRQIQDALSIADVAVLPTFYDPCSRFVLEALAAAKPVITTRFNGAAELFVNHRHGQVIDRPEDITALAGAIKHFTSTDNIRSASVAIVQDELKEQISISRAARQFSTLYEQIIKERRQQ